MGKKYFSRYILVVLALFFSQVCSSSDDHLVPNDDNRSTYKSYDEKLRYIFSDVYQENVVLKVLAQSSFSAEVFAGIRRTTAGDEAFMIEPSVKLSLYERLEQYEAQKLGGPRVYTMNEESYQSLRKEIGSDYRAVEVSKKYVPIPASVTERMLVVWKSALAGAKPLEKPGIYIDGGTVTFFVPKNERGAVSGSVYSPSNNTKMDRLWMLAASLRRYASGEVSISELEQVLLVSEADF